MPMGATYWDPPNSDVTGLTPIWPPVVGTMASWATLTLRATTLNLAVVVVEARAVVAKARVRSGGGASWR